MSYMGSVQLKLQLKRNLPRKRHSLRKQISKLCGFKPAPFCSAANIKWVYHQSCLSSQLVRTGTGSNRTVRDSTDVTSYSFLTRAIPTFRAKQNANLASRLPHALNPLSNTMRRTSKVYFGTKQTSERTAWWHQHTHTQVFSDKLPCELVHNYRRFGDLRLAHIWKMETRSS